MSYTDAIQYLYGLQKQGIKLGLDKVRDILSSLGDPQESFRTVHVAGTNGKGSVSSMVSSILMAHGQSTGLFTSPHLLSFTERIRVNGAQITEADVVALTEEIKAAVSHEPSVLSSITFFEFVMAMASVYFRKQGVDRAVMEVGMGGRLDATNVITPDVSVITRVGIDHKEFLGESLREIAGEKAGIIKKGIPVVASFQQKEVEEVIEEKCREVGAPLFRYGKDFEARLVSSGLEGITIHYDDGKVTLENLSIPLAGDHQLINASVAIKAALLALGETADPALVRKGLLQTRWPGRLDLVRRDPDIMIDGAHNPEAAEALAAFIKANLGNRPVILVMGVMSDKDVDGIITPLLPLAAETIFTAPNYGRAAAPEALAERASGMGLPSTTASSVREAIELAIQKGQGSRVKGPAIQQGPGSKVQGSETTKGQTGSSGNDLSSCLDPGPRTLDPMSAPLILITGSFYTIGEAMEVLGEKSILGSLREKL
ncbi:MAG: bifunctional folylpolyglutamate synthase/dihydrofolate synthase [Nitrospirales bacterium]|nr:bifunctional folylpolyglutamate synthase/dihydrofolate synthase [Nitrospirales bacterium]